MNNTWFKFALITTLTLIFSCQKENSTKDTYEYDCVFVQNDDDLDGRIDDTERGLMDECLENLLTSKSDIENNLIGRWELIGYGDGWQNTKSQPCGLILITENELTFDFENASINSVSTHQWDIVEENVTTGDKTFKLNILPEHVEGLTISHFCDNYMYGDATTRDGNMYFYRKVE